MPTTTQRTIYDPNAYDPLSLEEYHRQLRQQSQLQQQGAGVLGEYLQDPFSSGLFNQRQALLDRQLMQGAGENINRIAANAQMWERTPDYLESEMRRAERQFSGLRSNAFLGNLLGTEQFRRDAIGQAMGFQPTPPLQGTVVKTETPFDWGPIVGAIGGLVTSLIDPLNRKPGSSAGPAAAAAGGAAAGGVIGGAIGGGFGSPTTQPDTPGITATPGGPLDPNRPEQIDVGYKFPDTGGGGSFSTGPMSPGQFSLGSAQDISQLYQQPFGSIFRMPDNSLWKWENGQYQQFGGAATPTPSPLPSGLGGLNLGSTTPYPGALGGPRSLDLQTPLLDAPSLVGTANKGFWSSLGSASIPTWATMSLAGLAIARPFMEMIGVDPKTRLGGGLLGAGTGAALGATAATILGWLGTSAVGGPIAMAIGATVFGLKGLLHGKEHLIANEIVPYQQELDQSLAGLVGTANNLIKSGQFGTDNYAEAMTGLDALKEVWGETLTKWDDQGSGDAPRKAASTLNSQFDRWKAVYSFEALNQQLGAKATDGSLTQEDVDASIEQGRKLYDEWVQMYQGSFNENPIARAVGKELTQQWTEAQNRLAMHTLNNAMLA